MSDDRYAAGPVLSMYGGQPLFMRTYCRDCGAAVADRAAHDEFHRQLDDLFMLAGREL